MTSIDELPLMSREELTRRLASHVRPGSARWTPALTITDVARWTDVAYPTLLRAAKGAGTLSSRVQIRLTQFYGMMDSGALVMELHGKHKHFVRKGAPGRPSTQQAARVEFTAQGPVVRWS